MPLEGRGRDYSLARGASERVLARVFRGGWAPRLVDAAGLRPAVRVVRHHVRCAAWPAGLRALRIGFVSDLHAGPTTAPAQIEEAFTRVADEAPDVLLLGGDYVFLSRPPLDLLTRAIRRVAPPLGAFAVMGNHDLWGDDRAVARALEAAGARVMINAGAHLPSPFDAVSLVALDDPWTGERDAGAAFAGAGSIRVLLMHAPEGLLLVGDRPFDLAVCGHTHGGHVALPGGVPIVAPGALSRRYAHGRHDVGRGRTLVVSRGVGNTESPLRAFAPPDVLSITLGA